MVKKNELRYLLILLLCTCLSLLMPLESSASSKAVPLNNSTAMVKKNTSTKAIDNIKIKYYKVEDGIVAICKNNNKYAVSLSGTVSFLDAAKHVLTKSTDNNECLGAKQTCVLFFKGPLTLDGSKYALYYKYKSSIKAQKTSNVNYSNSIVATADMQPVAVNLSVLNIGKTKLDIVRVSVLLYDHDHKLIACIPKYVTCHKKGQTAMESLDYPSFARGADSVKVYVDCAYKKK